jgi:ABC-2 type transport system permease protein
VREVLALARASWLAASSYRLGLVISIAGMAVSFVPMYFVANAIQPLVADSIADQSDQYFSFLVVGVGMLSLITATAATLPGAISGSISSGTFEALIATPVTMTRLVAGLSSYAVIWSGFRTAVLLWGAVLIGAQVFQGGIPVSLLSVALLMLCYFSVALVASALILIFRTSGPLVTATIALSGLLGGVYYNTESIPSWIQTLSDFVPLTYGLRAARKALLSNAPWQEVSGDLFILAGMTVVLLTIGAACFQYGLRHSRKAGTLAQY